MCGRFALYCGIEKIAKRFKAGQTSVEFKACYNIVPSNDILVVVNSTGRRLALFRWGLIPAWAKDIAMGQKMINARTETLDTKPAFKKPLKKQRCLIIAEGFYEWRKEGKRKIPMYIHLKSQEPFAFAGLWDIWSSPGKEKITSCTIITTESNALVKQIHERMPVILTGETEDCWLDTSMEDPGRLLACLKPYPVEAMEAHEVSRMVNSPVYDGPDCIKPVA